MAEILGIAASGLSIGSLAIQIFASVQQIKHIWTAFKDVPEDILILCEELNLLAKLLSDTESIEGISQGASAEAVRYCQKATIRIEIVVNELSGGLKEAKSRIKRWTAVKAVMKEKGLKKYLARLERAKSMLSLALQFLEHHKNDSYHNSQCNKLQVIEERLLKATSEQSMTLSTVPQSSGTHFMAQSQQDTDSTSMTPFHEQSKRPNGLSLMTNMSYWLVFGSIRLIFTTTSDGNRGANIINWSRSIGFHPSFWLLRRDFQFVYEHIHGAWRFSFRTYRIVTTQDPVFQACINNDLDLVKQLCSNGQASPFDVLSRGWTLLHLAAALSFPELCYWLIDQGLDGNCSANGEDGYFHTSITPLMVTARYQAIPKHSSYAKKINFYPDNCLQNEDWILYRDLEDLPNAIDTFRVLVEHGGSDPMQSDQYHRTALHQHHESTDILRYMLHQERFQIDLLEVDNFGQTVVDRQLRLPYSLGVIDLILNEFSAQRYMCRLSLDNYNLRFLHTLMERFAAQHSRERACSTNSYKMLNYLIQAKVDLHGILPDRYGSTLMTALRIAANGNSITLSCRDPKRQARFKDKTLDMSLRAWLRVLRENNVDLQRYLREEERLSQTLQPMTYLPQYFHGENEEISFNSRLIYKLEWHFAYHGNENANSVSVEYVLENTEKTAVRQREERGKKIPGAWVEED